MTTMTSNSAEALALDLATPETNARSRRPLKIEFGVGASTVSSNRVPSSELAGEDVRQIRSKQTVNGVAEHLRWGIIPSLSDTPSQILIRAFACRGYC